MDDNIYDDADEALLKAIAKIAARAAEITGAVASEPVLNLAKAANELSEARAWLMNSSQAHG